MLHKIKIIKKKISLQVPNPKLPFWFPSKWPFGASDCGCFSLKRFRPQLYEIDVFSKLISGYWDNCRGAKCS